MTGEDIKKVFREFSVLHQLFSDTVYDKPKKSWILNEFYSWYSNVYLSLVGINKWQKKFDCDDFAASFKLGAQVAHSKSKGKNDGFAVGVIWYNDEKMGYHAINAVFTDKGLIFVEPQNGKEKKLSKDEKNSIYFVKF